MRCLSPAERAIRSAPVVEESGFPAPQLPLFKKGARGTGKRRRPAETPAKRTYREAQRQAAGVKALKIRGYIVGENSEHRRASQCPHCGGWSTPAGGMGQTAGLGDLVITAEWWAQCLWMMAETKADSKAPLRPGQQRLLDAGRLVIWWEVEQLLRAVEQFERVNGCERPGREARC